MATPQIPQEFFTLQSMLTLTGAAGATFLICNGIQRAFNVNPRWLALLVAEILAIYGTYASHANGAHPSDYFVAIVNGFLIFATAAGATNMGGGAAAPATQERGATSTASTTEARRKRRFFTPWF
jgi:hypothetical protein